MLRSTKTALIAIAILLCVIVVIILLNIQNFGSSLEEECLKFEDITCHTKDSNPYRLYGTKTAYHIARLNHSSTLDVGECVPKVFYLMCRHATRYPDRENIEDMINFLPKIKDAIRNNSQLGEVKMCEEDLKNLEAWTQKLKPENDNKISQTGVEEAIELAERFKARFPSILDQPYSPTKFVFEYTSRERTRTTAEAFAFGLFHEDSRKISFDNRTNDRVLQFHKECKSMREKCEDPNYDTSEIDKFEGGPLMQKVIKSVSDRIGISLTYDHLKILLKACAFGYALNFGDQWCSLFTSDELKVLELNDDIDDFYKDSYGNKVNHEQACPVVDHVLDFFNYSIASNETKALLHFSHAGGIKKVFSIFGLFRDEKRLTADDYCSQQSRKWRSSNIAPFLANLALVLYDCGSEYKIAAFHNEMPVKLDGCKDKLCTFDEFSNAYFSVAEKCDLNEICCTCCIY